MELYGEKQFVALKRGCGLFTALVSRAKSSTKTNRVHETRRRSPASHLLGHLPWSNVLEETYSSSRV